MARQNYDYIRLVKLILILILVLLVLSLISKFFALVFGNTLGGIFALIALVIAVLWLLTKKGQRKVKEVLDDIGL